MESLRNRSVQTVSACFYQMAAVHAVAVGPAVRLEEARDEVVVEHGRDKVLTAAEALDRAAEEQKRVAQVKEWLGASACTAHWQDI